MEVIRLEVDLGCVVMMERRLQTLKVKRFRNDLLYSFLLLIVFLKH